MVIERCVRMLRDWHLIQKFKDAVTLEAWREELEERGARPSMLMWDLQRVM
jgi:hypothetical protein